MTAAERAAEINKADPDPLKLCEDQQRWDGYGVKTAEDLDQYLDAETYINVYKDRYGVRPRTIPGPDQIQAETERISRPDPKPAQPTKPAVAGLDPWREQLQALGESLSKKHQ